MQNNCLECKKLTGGLCKKCLEIQDNNFMNQTKTQLREKFEKEVPSYSMNEYRMEGNIIRPLMVQKEDVLNFMNQTNNRIREEWKTEYCKKFGLCKEISSSAKCQCKKELDFISELLKSQKESLVEKIKAISSTSDECCIMCARNIINLIKEE